MSSGPCSGWSDWGSPGRLPPPGSEPLKRPLRGRRGRTWYGRSIVWVLTNAAKDEARRAQRRERDRARRQKRRYEADQEDEESRMAWQHLQDRAHDTARLEHLLGMLGSAHEGEVLNAARLAEKERRRLGKTWKEILGRAI